MAVAKPPIQTDAEELVGIRREIDALEHRFAKVLASFVRTGEWPDDGAVSPKA